jgi:hypothetical protein
MRKVLLSSAAALLFAGGLLTFTSVPVVGQRANPEAQAAKPAATAGTFKTPWGEPDLQGIWMPEFMTPFERPDWVGGRELFTDEERKGLDDRRAKRLGRDFRATKGTVADVSGAYSEVFRTRKRTGPRTSLIIDPPNGKMPPFTPEVQKRRQAWREYELMLLQASQACKDGEAVCRGGNYAPPSPRFHDPAPIYPVNGVNRSDHPEDHGLIVRCLSGYIPAGGNAPGSPAPTGHTTRSAESCRRLAASA